MKIIISESRRNEILFKWLDNHYGNLSKDVYLNPFDIEVFYYYNPINGNRELEYYNFSNGEGVLTVSNDILEFLNKILDVNLNEVYPIILEWFRKKYLNKKGVN